MSVQPELWLYGSIRIRSMESRMIGRAGLERLLEAGSPARCAALLPELGVETVTDPASGALLREETLSLRLRRAYSEALAAAEDADFLRLWLYPYDCNNIKAAVKCFRRGADVNGLLFDFGTVERERILAVAAGHSEAAGLPAPFGEAAEEAADAFARTGNPQRVDLLLDRACYRAMLAEAAGSGEEFCLRLVREKIDLTNLMTCLRLLRMGGVSAVGELLPEALLEGGTLPPADLVARCAGGEQAFCAWLPLSDYRIFAAALPGPGGSLSAAQTAADNQWMERIREAKMVPYGPPPLIGYLLGSEYEVRNLRILLAGLEAGLPAATLRERMRESYV